MKKVLLLTILFSGFTLTHAQKSKTDSLRRVLQTQKQDTNRVHTLSNLAYLYRAVPDTSLRLSMEALELSSSLNYRKGIDFNLGNMAIEYMFTGNYPQALNCTFKKLKIDEAEHDTVAIAGAYNLLGLLHREQGNNREALNYLSKGLSIAQRGDLFLNISESYSNLHVVDSASTYARKGLNIATKSGSPDFRQWAYWRMAAAFQDEGKYKLAQTYYDSSLSINLKYNLSPWLAYLGLASLYEKTGQLDSSLYYARLCLAKVSQTGLYNARKKVIPIFTSVFEKMHNADSALFYMKLDKAVNDSMFSQQKLSQLQSLAFNEKIQEKEKEEAVRKAKEKLRNQVIIFSLLGAMIVFGAIAFILYWNNKQKQKANKLLQQQKEEIDNKNKELEIENALEKVRGRSMAMQKSEELREVVQVIFDQLCGLDFKIESASFLEEIDETNDFRCWMAANGNQYASRIDVPYLDHPVFNRMIEAKEKGEAFFTLLLTMEEKNRFFDHYFKFAPVPEERKFDIYDSKGWAHAVVLMNTIGLSINNYAPLPYSEEQNKTLVRFGKAFEQAYTRFLDLQKAEAQAKEAQIEAALERIRSSSMAMQKSEELRDVIQLILDQLYGLHFSIDSASILVEVNESNDLRYWVAAPGQQYAARMDIPYTDHPIFNRLVEAKEKGEAFFTLLLSKEEKDRFFDHYFKFAPIPEERKSFIYHSNGWASSTVLFNTVILSIQNFSAIPYSDEQNKALVRFGKAFEQTYTRFLDLQKAETQALEAQIEAALERVRSRSMAMQKSEELRDVLQLILDQLCGLHFSIDSASFTVDINNDNGFSTWLAAPGQQYAMLISFPYLNNPVFNKLLEANRKGENFLTYTMSKEEKDHFFDHFINCVPTVPEERKQFWYNSAGWATSAVLMKSLWLAIQNYSGIPYSGEENKILMRFGKAFEQTYTRFLDLQKAEAAAKEAVKQASVDRVRAEIASMRTTNDLDRIIPLVWNELTILHIPFIRCGVFIVNEATLQTQVYLSTPEGKAIAAFQIPFDSKGLNEEMLQHWRNNQIFKDYWDAATFSAWTHSLIEAGAIHPDERYSNEQPPENLYLHFVPFMQGMLYVGNTEPLSADELSLIESLADAFATAYARYDDFSKLEAAKQQIEVTLSELKAAQTQLIQSEKMASLGELTAGIAHEIQNPLNFVNNFSDVNKELITEMKEEIDKGNIEEVKSIAKDIEENEVKINHHGKRADAIVKGMLQHSRTNTGKKEPTDINALADEYLRLSYHGVRAKDKDFNANFTTQFDESIGKIEVVPQDIGRVLLNLYNNAFYAVNEKKRQLNGTFEPTVTVITKRTADRVEILVKDNGNGIPQKVVDKIFQPFFTTKPTGQGTGLGLSLSYDIIKAHGGEIKVKSKKGEGGEFIIILPLDAKLSNIDL